MQIPALPVPDALTEPVWASVMGLTCAGRACGEIGPCCLSIEWQGEGFCGMNEKAGNVGGASDMGAGKRRVVVEEVG